MFYMYRAAVRETDSSCACSKGQQHATFRNENEKEQVKMSLKTAKTWFIRLIPLVLLFISYCCTQVYMHSKATIPSRPLCESWYTSKKYESLGLNITRKNKLFLNLEDFFWKNVSASLPLPYGIKGSELLLLKVLAVIASYEMPQSIESLDCRRCVVVGNGFSIKNTSLGGTINKYDVVIRVNDAPVRGYEADVGNKTTMRFFYPESASVNPYIHNDPDTVMVLVPFKQQDLRWMKEILYDEKRVRKGFWKPPPQIWQAKTSQIRILDPFFLHETETRLLNLTVNVNPKSREKLTQPTTGILAIYVALNYCDVVHVAGFGYPKVSEQKHPIHYYGYDTMKSMKNSYHDLTREAKALKKLEDLGVISYLHPHS
ncbi:CMP-N-acetylneuraminate-beta-galactosamide-alpha-2,3-sialyltransferase 4 isoform X2 [Lepisosteus oculatus]|uniref:CMP-N-acetylneuraminate-beta-galactosamide- alpha-2,3-sialyltransferase 4 isoform X2 n=1 Tax=Lepisosteus oculatus TaxID=7918 RepID=UPI00371A4330